MANKYRGEVEFTNEADGKTYVLRLGTNEWISIAGAAAKLDGMEWTRLVFRAALIHGKEDQAEMSLEDVGELMDEIGHVKVDELIKQTRWGVMTSAQIAKLQAEIDKKKAEATATGNPPQTTTPSNG